VAAFVVALGAVAGGALLFFYDRATAIDRSTPQVVTDQFLDATLVLNDPARVGLFVCDRWSAEDAMAKVGAPTDSSMSASWGISVVDATDSSATVSARVTFRFRDSRRQVETLTLSLVDEGGWRVCDLTEEPSL
jgi:hypothetical protein